MNKLNELEKLGLEVEEMTNELKKMKKKRAYYIHEMMCASDDGETFKYQKKFIASIFDVSVSILYYWSPVETNYSDLKKCDIKEEEIVEFADKYNQFLLEYKVKKYKLTRMLTELYEEKCGNKYKYRIEDLALKSRLTCDLVCKNVASRIRRRYRRNNHK